VKQKTWELDGLFFSMTMPTTVLKFSTLVDFRRTFRMTCWDTYRGLQYILVLFLRASLRNSMVTHPGFVSPVEGLVWAPVNATERLGPLAGRYDFLCSNND